MCDNLWLSIKGVPICEVGTEEEEQLRVNDPVGVKALLDKDKSTSHMCVVLHTSKDRDLAKTVFS